MASRPRTERPSHRCSECGASVAKWQGRCPECQAWGTLAEVRTPGVTPRVVAAPAAVSTAARPMTEIAVEAATARATGVDELDRVLGGGLVPGVVVLLAGEPGAGKALAIDTPIPTPSGWTTMAKVSPGQQVLAADGTATTVVAVSEVMDQRPCYELEFCDGSTLVADAQHEWLTSTRRERLHGRPSSRRTTEELAATLTHGSDGRRNHAVTAAAPLQLPEAPLPLPPYTLGAWLGDGASATGNITSADPEILAAIEAEGVVVRPLVRRLRYGLSLPADGPVHLERRACTVCGARFYPKAERTITCSASCAKRAGGTSPSRPDPRCTHCGKPLAALRGYTGSCSVCRSVRSFTGRLRELGVLLNKHIPLMYLRSSEAQRRALLAGLLDTDGTVSKQGCVSLCLTDKQLAEDAYELIVSLGYKPKRTQKRVQGRSEGSSVAYFVSFSTADKVFRLQRKLSRLNGSERATQRRRYVVAVKPVPSTPVRCLQVDHPSALFLAGRSMIPTHNSTLALEVGARAARGGQRVLYVSGEESAAQVRLRAGRTGALEERLYMAAETDLGAVLTHLDAVQPGLLVVDSVQTVASAEVDGGAGGVSQVRAVAAALIGTAKERGLATILIGHVTKDGSVAGPRLLEHLVDVVLHFEGDRHSSLRLVRAVKNRFGPADEVGCFTLTDSGIVGLADPSGLFLSSRQAPAPGTCITVTVEGRRPLPAEVQALLAARTGASPRRAVSGLDAGRVAMVLAVLEQHAGAPLGDRDAYLATVGGVRLGEPATDLAVGLAVASAFTGSPLPPGLVAIGELGLSGEVRPVPGVARRLVEAGRLGLRTALVPPGSGDPPAGMNVLEVASIEDALDAVRGLLGRGPRARTVRAEQAGAARPARVPLTEAPPRPRLVLAEPAS